MNIELTLFKQLSDTVFATASRYFGNDARKAYYSKWQDYCANGTQRVFITGDIKQAQKMYHAAVICGFLPQFIRACVPQIPFAFKRSDGFDGKIQGPKRNVLETLNADGIPNWEAEMRTRFDSENETKAPAAFVLTKRLEAVIKKDRQQEVAHTDAEVRKVLNEMLKLYPAIHEVEVQEVAQGQAQEVKDLAAKAA